MNHASYLRSRSIVALTLALVFVLVAGFGVTYCIDRAASQGDPHCVMMGGMNERGGMTIGEHLVAWSQLFVFSAAGSTAMLLVLVALLFVVSSFILHLLHANSSAENYQELDDPPELFRQPLRLALAAGIIHPKIYA